MDYLFENLGDERFQEFCNCLISKEYNDIQAFPVGQPDGGRDSIVYLRNIRNENFNGFYVFQVKYVRNPYTIQDIHKWFTNIIKEEAPKINKLIPRGAKKYILITNVKGTAHLGAGSIDKVNNILKENINIPSMCWWRDDICIRIEKDPIFKWSFPEILNGQDILNSILFEYISEKREKRESIIKAYLADQYDIDNEVKFKQIDLRNKLLDLFTDVPLRIKDFDDKDKVFRNLIMSLEYSGIHIHKRFDSYGEEKEYSTAANFILSSFAQNSIPKLLLEGGPGQGKSTISQYVCQVHRVRLLNKKNDLNSIPLELKKSPIRIPIKIDLRHISSWIEHKNPYENILSNEYYNSIWSNSLESFLVGHIVYHSQNRDTTISDIISIMKESAILIVFDGFDEIANIQSRKEVVEFINKGVNRLSQNSKSLQVLITSRPAAFADAIGFSIEDYPHFELTDITSQTINEYVDKWINASQLNRRESIEIKKLVDEKLKLPHLKELAKSPMQLAILISLLRTRGESLPNKRTALYDSYIDLFFNREAEKSTMIRDNRYLIMEIHEYLAWILHSEAELTNSNGTIQLEELKLKLNGYLEKEGHSTELGETLFNVVKERVCALVSRVQGTFEFEVQPLREYFCAKFLYNTAPYSPTGEEKKGTKPDRFDAIARNYYWQNVVRFFSGCFDKGELPMLVDQLIILQEDDLLKYTNYPSLLMSQTLSDWVFSQSPRMSNKIIDKLIEDIKNGKIVEQDEIYGSSFMALPIECGSENISMACLKKLQEFPPKDHVLELANIIRSNLYGVNNFWLDYLKIFKDEELTLWLEYGLYIGLIKKVDSKIILDVINNKGTPTETKKRIQILIRGERFDIINGNIDIKRKALDGILDNKMFIWRKGFHQTSIGLINLIFDPYMLNKIINMEGSSHLPFLSEINSNLNDFEEVHKDISFSNISGESDTIDSLINSFFKNISELLNTEIYQWQKSVDHWDKLVESLRENFGETRIGQIVSIIAAGIKSKTQVYEEYSSLSDNSLSLCKRVRSARMKSGNIQYWKEQLETSSDIVFTLLVMLTWATPRVIDSLKTELNIIIQNLSLENYIDLSNLVSRLDNNKSGSEKLLNNILIDRNIADEFKFLLRNRLTFENRYNLIVYNINFEKEKLIEFSGFSMVFLIREFLKKPNDKLLLEKIRSIYSNSFDSFSHFPRGQKSVFIPYDLAKTIITSPLSYPRYIVSIAEKSCLQYSNSKIIPVGKIAEKEKWFE